MHFLRTACFSLFVFACSSASEEPTRWVDAPSSNVTLLQGIPATIPFHLSRAATTTVQVPAGIHAIVAGDSLTVSADYGAFGISDLSLQLHSSTDTTTHKLAVQVKPLSWIDKTTWAAGAGPQEREHPALLFDPKVKMLYLLQGSGYHPQFTPIADNWKYDIAMKKWSTWDLQNAPEPGLGRRVAGPLKDGTFLVHGGEAKGEVESNDLYKVTPSTGVFEKVDQENPPDARTLHVFAFDAGIGKGMTFGGFSYGGGGAILPDTAIFTFDGKRATWKRIATTRKTAPSPRYGAFGALDSVLHKVFVFSGAQTPLEERGTGSVNAANDVWAFDLASETWELVDTSTSPTGRRNGCVMLDSRTHRMFVFGGTADAKTSIPGLSILDVQSRSWSTLSNDLPPIRSSGVGFFDSESSTAYCGFGNGDALYRDMNGFGYP